MRSLGLVALLLGIGSFVLPKFEYQFRLFEPLEPYQPWSGIGLGVLGLLLMMLGGRRAKPAAQK